VIAGRYLPYGDVRHGSERGYAAGCRQDCCRLPHRRYTRIKKAERIAKGVPEHVHGTANGYNNYGCRCDLCQVAAVKSVAQRKKKRRGT
jgi:hypothetical protein